MTETVTILGSTGSIGLSTLDVLRRHKDKYQVYALTANRSVETMLEQCREFEPEVAVMLDESAAEQLDNRLKQYDLPTTVLTGVKALESAASAEQVKVVVAAIVGAAGLMPTLAAANTGKRILLANKEALVMSGALFMDVVQRNQAVLLPVDSEHNAIWQCLPVHNEQHHDFRGRGIRRIILTASGGPFRDLALDKFVDVTPEQAVAHPNWSMGKKISVDSATMMNKGLEVIEAYWLFGLDRNQIDVVLHRQSIIHSMVDYDDGSVLAQMGNPDMRTPIANTLAWPQRIDSGVEPLDLVKVGQLDFKQADFARYPCLKLAYDALAAGGTMTAILNAANEIAVDAFLSQQIRFTDIAEVIQQTMNEVKQHEATSLELILSDDEQARQVAGDVVKTCKQ